MAARAPLGKLGTLLSSKAKRQVAVDALITVDNILADKHNDVVASLGKDIGGYILSENEHISRTDPVPHYTVDAFGPVDPVSKMAEPIGCIHVYKSLSSLTANNTPRALLRAEYNKKRAQIQAGTSEPSESSSS